VEQVEVSKTAEDALRVRRTCPAPLQSGHFSGLVPGRLLTPLQVEHSSTLAISTSRLAPK
jgi:hypothetical protein